MANTASARPVLVDHFIDDSRLHTALVVGGGCLLMALLAQIRIPLWFTPVPITGQTFGVALLGGALGGTRGAACLALYVGLGALGCPFYAGGEGGWQLVAGATGGYLVGFVPAAWVVGKLAERRGERQMWRAFLTFQVGSLIVFLFGVSWLAMSAGLSFEEALRLGWLPFIPGDLFKTLLAAGLFPTAWTALRRKSD